MTTSCTYTLLLAFVISELKAPMSSALCGVSEFSCDNGKCVRQNMYCNGREDCGDGSDEPRGCVAACNRTFNGEVNVKYRLHISEPFHRHIPFLCIVSFVTDGAQYGDYVELQFLSFNVGSLEKGSSSPTCYGGHLQVIDYKSTEGDINHQQTRGLSQLVSAIKQTNGMLPNLYNLTGRNTPHFGFFCGQMAGQSVNYFSSGNNVTLAIFMPSRTSWRSQSFNVFLTYKFMTKRTNLEVRKDDIKDFGKSIPNSFCNVEYQDCANKICVIRSPNFPGTFLPNFTCLYLIKQRNIPKGLQAQIVLRQDNEYKISIDNGHSGIGAISSSLLTTDCSQDMVRVFDGSTSTSTILTEFCGSGPLPPIISSHSSVLIQLISAPYQRLHDSRLEIEAQVRFVKSPLWRISGNNCKFLLDGSHKTSGIIRNPQHTVSPQTTCTYILRGRNPSDRVWMYLMSYMVEDKHPWSLTEHCDTGRMEILGSASPDYFGISEFNSVKNNHTYCEKSFPRLCARATDAPNLIPLHPCRFPEESYFSKGPQLVLRLHYPKTSGIPAVQPLFMARYEFVDTRQPGVAVPSSLCDRIVKSQSSSKGNIFSPRNVLYFGRGGRSDVSCRYNLQGKGSSRVKLAFQSLQLFSSSCKTVVDNVSHERTCEIIKTHNGPLSFIKVVENWQGVELSIGCFCNISLTPLVHNPVELTSLGNNVSVIFTVKGMNSLQDFRNFNFEANFEFFFFPVCDATSNERHGSKGILTFTVSSSMLLKYGQFRCRWTLTTSVGKHFYLTFRGTNGSTKCGSSNVLKAYSEVSNMADSTICINENATERKVFLPSRYIEGVVSHSRDLLAQEPSHIILEAFIKEPQTVRVEWDEVTKPFMKRNTGQSLRKINCLFRCPEINACISPDLWCDGKEHCPAGYDEAAEHCHRFPLLYVAAGGGVTLFLLVLVLLAVIVRCQKHEHHETVDHFEMGNRCRAQDDQYLKY
ncbi:uncharacterized protein LOC143255011 isoform X3 [Tachypleus tridentatus]|uniref:uncharacterized protein LOC143255011 isoform X3 n=1 Tax=Tachypleus tridentatus TaxID=6853 RepID=UPI003FD0890B